MAGKKKTKPKRRVRRSANKVTNSAIESLSSKVLLDELHHLLWIEPHENQGTWDEGWNCRDHALISGIVAQLLGQTAFVMYGEATFIQGAKGDSPPVGICQSTHAWLVIGRSLHFDLSPRLTSCREPKWRSWPLTCIAQNECLPEGKFMIARSATEYEQLVAKASHSPDRHAIYHGKGYDQIDSDFVTKAFEFVNSPMTIILSKLYESKVYAQAAIHLYKLLRNESTSLCQLSQRDAWEHVSNQPEDPIGWLNTNGGIR